MKEKIHMNNRTYGDLGEETAAAYLARKGYRK